jgi:acetylglutamate kinase
MFDKGECLVEVLPYIKKFFEKNIVIKYGGSAMIDDGLKNSFSKDVSLLKYVGINPVVVHGGGPEIGATLSKLSIESKFHNGLRITDESTMEVVVMVLAGKINKEIVLNINKSGAKAVGISGVDASIVEAQKKLMEDVDLGLVGDVKTINPSIINHLTQSGYIPVVAPIGVDDEGKRYNINADSVASAVAISLKAEKLIFLTDADGVLDKNGSLISSIEISDISGMIEDGTISGGMIPKILSSKDAIERGVGKVHIINGKKTHSLLEEVFTQSGIGTEIYEKR